VKKVYIHYGKRSDNTAPASLMSWLGQNRADHHYFRRKIARIWLVFFLWETDIGTGFCKGMTAGHDQKEGAFFSW
jgi:hypothetical protein